MIFERVKEEIRAGRSVPAGIAAGYRKGLAAIIDANVVTFMVAFILFVLATAGVKGFAFVLGIGTLVSLFTAILLDAGRPGHDGPLAPHHAPGRPRLPQGPQAPWDGFDFMGASKWFFSLSGVILLIGALAIGGKGLKFGIDFESGTRVARRAGQAGDENGIRRRCRARAAGSATPRSSGSRTRAWARTPSRSRPPSSSPTQVAQVTQRAAAQRTAIRGQPDTQSIGPTFGNTVAKGAIIAIIVVAAGHQRLHRAAVRVEVRGARWSSP